MTNFNISEMITSAMYALSKNKIEKVVNLTFIGGYDYATCEKYEGNTSYEFNSSQDALRKVAFSSLSKLVAVSRTITSDDVISVNGIDNSGNGVTIEIYFSK